MKMATLLKKNIPRGAAERTAENLSLTIKALNDVAVQTEEKNKPSN